MTETDKNEKVVRLPTKYYTAFSLSVKVLAQPGIHVHDVLEKIRRA